MTDAEIIKWAGSSGLVAGAAYGVKWAWDWFWTQFERRLKTVEESCAKCRAEMELRLSNGATHFEELENATQTIRLNTQQQIMDVVLKSSETNARHREKMVEDFVSEKTFKDRVLAMMIANCPNCRKGGN